MSDNTLDEQAEEERERRNKRIARVRRELKAWLIAFLSIAPQLRVSNKAIVIAIVSLALSLGLLFSGLGEIAELSACLLLTAWIVTVCIHCANAVKAERAKNPD